MKICQDGATTRNFNYQFSSRCQPYKTLNTVKTKETMAIFIIILNCLVPDQTFKLYLTSSGPVLDILNLAWSVKFGKKINL